MTNVKGALCLSAAASIWGGMYVASKYVLAVVPPFTLMAIRYIIAFIVLAIICRYNRISLIPRTNKFILFQIGFFGYFLSIAGQFIGTKLSSAHMGAVITTLSPVFQSAFAIWLLQEPLTARQLISITLSFAGVLIMNGMDGFTGGGHLQTGAFFLLLAALFWGYYSVLVRKISDHYSALQITAIGVFIAAAASLPAAWHELKGLEFTLVLTTGPVAFSLFYIGVISTAGAFLLWNKGLALVPAHQAGLFFFLQPLVGSFLGWAVLDEHLSWPFYLGSLLILVAVYLVMQPNAAAATERHR
ncbi:DMT family transporter|uniref:Threonine/homoserine efflux transporter RhtA n=1 Tax=Dendrosporobacter quercicolus TaxID=146817 RepID=A0A1G9U9X8_9FIRM|nr:DMT family transporter [Dendrosporobacter quercicolus]NSL49954.1 DMT family transporter [Dendrosporobacter quercicolus DSM 1736]SDM56345.1 Threonine/homoserine efflux transporter RhtA [Dendrosporobacter quercicolus]